MFIRKTKKGKIDLTHTLYNIYHYRINFNLTFYFNSPLHPTFINYINYKLQTNFQNLIYFQI